MEYGHLLPDVRFPFLSGKVCPEQGDDAIAECNVERRPVLLIRETVYTFEISILRRTDPVSYTHLGCHAEHCFSNAPAPHVAQEE